MGQFVTIRDFFLDVFFPKVCNHCGDSFRDGLSNVLCQSCFNGIEPYQSPSCDHCGVSLPPRAFEGVVQPRCEDCGDWPYYLDQTWSLGSYEGPLRLAHHAFKFGGMEHLKSPIVKKMLSHLPKNFGNGIETIVPVPMSPEKERERGYNPASLLATELSTNLDVPVKSVLKKVRSTVPQRLLARDKRLKNQKGVFQVVGNNPFLKVLLVDDVFTTGATLEECAKILKKAGAQWVCAVVWGRTPHHGSDRGAD
jgi:ComF family protein